jgi:hypothetical protein
MLAGTQHWFGLTIGESFPIALVVAGLGVCVHALIDDPNAKKSKETKQ